MRLGERVFERFQTAKTGSILAYLAWQRRPVARDVLLDLLWPDAELDAARNRLRVALNSLRRQVEPPGVPGGAVLVADRSQVSLNPAAYVTDVAEFEAALERERTAATDAERIDCLREAVRLYRGELLDGLYDDWVLPERTRLADACLGALKRLTRLLAQAHEYEAALDCARKAVVLDPLGEGGHRTIMRLYAPTGRPGAAARQYSDLAALLQEELGARPSSATRKLARKVAHTSRPGRNDGAETGSEARPPAPPRRIGRRKPEAPTTAPEASAQPVPAPGGGIPLQFTRFFGRERQLAHLLALLDPAAVPALVTLTGPGGIGKTRLAAETAMRLREAYFERVWFVSLGDAGSGKDPLAMLASALRVGVAPGVPVASLIQGHLASAPSLLVFDDGDDSPQQAQVMEWLRASVPRLGLLVTSRRRLDLDGEIESVVHPLPRPGPGKSPLELLACPAVALFADRAQAVRPDFQVTAGNAPVVAALCERLEGIPLALELAAAWAQVLTPSQMLERLGNRFDLLVSRRRTREERHRSLRACIESTWEMLPEALRAFFRRVAIFREGWSLEAVEAVLCEPRALEFLEGLRAYALVRVGEYGSGMRFHLLDSLREFAAEQMDEGEGRCLGESHARHYATWVEAARAALVGPDADAWLERLEQDHDNLVAGLDWWFEHGEPAEGLAMATAMGRFWIAQGHLKEGARWLRRALREAPIEGTGDLRAGAHETLGRLMASQEDRLESFECFREALRLASPDADVARTVLSHLWVVASELGDLAAAREACARRVAAARAGADCWALARALTDLGRTALAQGHRADAASATRETLALRRALGDRWGVADALLTLAGAEEDHASMHQAEGNAIFQTMEDVYGLGATCLNVGSLASEQGDLPLARALLEDALETFRSLQDQWYQALCLEQLGRVTARQGDGGTARASLVEALTLRRDLNDTDGAARLATLLADVPTPAP